MVFSAVVKLVALISTWAAGGIADTDLTPAALVLRKAIRLQYTPPGPLSSQGTYPLTGIFSGGAAKIWQLVEYHTNSWRCHTNSNYLFVFPAGAMRSDSLKHHPVSERLKQNVY